MDCSKSMVNPLHVYWHVSPQMGLNGFRWSRELLNSLTKKPVMKDRRSRSLVIGVIFE